MKNRVWITECPRDAMQGLSGFIETRSKISYLNALLQVGFDRLDFGSFVSPKAIPQMRDTAEVLAGLNKSEKTSLLAIIANERGASDALAHERIDILGYPFSISETFQIKNTNTGLEDSFNRVKNILNLTSEKGRELLVYISMAFGNPYGDKWDAGVVESWIEKLIKAGVKKFALADTVGLAEPGDVKYLVSSVLKSFPEVETGVHLHCLPNNWKAKVEAAYDSGCRRFDAAIHGMGGCPMAKDELVGNLATENLLQYLKDKNAETQIVNEEFNKALIASSEVFEVA